MPSRILPELYCDLPGMPGFSRLEHEARRVIDHFRNGFPMPEAMEMPVFRDLQRRVIDSPATENVAAAVDCKD